MRVSITDKLGKISEMLEKVANISGFLIIDTKICNTDDDTFQRLRVKNDSIITLNEGACAGKTPVRWVRFTDYPS